MIKCYLRLCCACIPAKGRFRSKTDEDNLVTVTPVHSLSDNDNEHDNSNKMNDTNDIRVARNRHLALVYFTHLLLRDKKKQEEENIKGEPIL